MVEAPKRSSQTQQKLLGSPTKLQHLPGAAMVLSSLKRSLVHLEATGAPHKAKPRP